jgi:hypothetical protein
MHKSGYGWEALSSCHLLLILEESKLAHHAQNVGVGPLFGYLASLNAAHVDARQFHLLASGSTACQPPKMGAASLKAGRHLVCFGYLILYGDLQIRESSATCGGYLSRGLHAVYVLASWYCCCRALVDEDVWGVDLLGGVKVPWVKISSNSLRADALFTSADKPWSSLLSR